ncbi:hypothetical protein D3C78_1743180 [compost metagenome]
MQRAAPDFDLRAVLDVLDKAGWIADRDKGGKRSKKVKVGGRSLGLYHLHPLED